MVKWLEPVSWDIKAEVKTTYVLQVRWEIVGD